MNAESSNLSENISSKLNGLVNWLDTAAKTTGDFVSEQTPLYVSEYLAYNFWVSLIWFCIAAAFLILFLFVIGWAIYRAKKDGHLTDWHIGIPVVFALASFVPIIGMIENSDWSKIKLAPRVYIVENIKNILK